jgi:6-phosphogluconolactonase (cycloisomerase 2 family)
MQRLLCFLLLGIVLIVSGCGSARKQHEFAYVLDQGENAIVIMSVDPDTGLLTTVGSANTDAGPTAIAISPTNQSLYVTHSSSENTVNTIVAFAIASDGSLSRLGPALTTDINPFSMSFDPSGSFIYVANFNVTSISVFNIAPDGSLIASSPIAFNTSGAHQPLSLAVNPFGGFLYVPVTDGNQVFSFKMNSDTGALTQLGNAVSTGRMPTSIAVDSSGKAAIVANYGDSTVSTFTVAPDGSLSPAQSVTLTPNSQPTSVTAHPMAPYVYAADQLAADQITNTQNSHVYAFSIDTSSGALTPLGQVLDTGANPVNVSVDLYGKYVYVACGDNTVYVYAIASDGSLSLVNGSPVLTGTTPVAIAFALK